MAVDAILAVFDGSNYCYLYDIQITGNGKDNGILIIIPSIEPVNVAHVASYFVYGAPDKVQDEFLQVIVVVYNNNNNNNNNNGSNVIENEFPHKWDYLTRSKYDISNTIDVFDAEWIETTHLQCVFVYLISKKDSFLFRICVIDFISSACGLPRLSTSLLMIAM